MNMAIAPGKALAIVAGRTRLGLHISMTTRLKSVFDSRKPLSSVRLLLLAIWILKTLWENTKLMKYKHGV